jgi:hypothetical protein
MRYSLLFFIIFISAFILVNTASAFSFTGHVVIAQIAYDHLSPPVRKRADALASLL